MKPGNDIRWELHPLLPYKTISLYQRDSFGRRIIDIHAPEAPFQLQGLSPDSWSNRAARTGNTQDEGQIRPSILNIINNAMPAQNGNLRSISVEIQL